MITRPFIVLALVAASALTIAAQDRPQPPSAGDKDAMKITIHRLADTKWVDGPPSLPKGPKMAVLEGDPAKAGPFVFRLRLPDGFRIPPHTHSDIERLTILQGTFNIGMGEKFDESASESLPTGSFGYLPAGMKHFAWTKGETILQFHGQGPWTINYLNPADDPRNTKPQ